MFIAKHDEAQDLEQHRRAAVVAQPSEHRTRRLENEENRVEIRVVMSMPPTDAAATTSRLATPRGVDNDLSGARDPGSASTLGMFSPAMSTGLESAREPGPSTATVNSDAARVTELNRGNQSRHVQEAHQESTGYSSTHPLRREELIPDSMRKKITLRDEDTESLPQYLRPPQECACEDFGLGVLHPSRASHAGAGTNS